MFNFLKLFIMKAKMMSLAFVASIMLSSLITVPATAQVSVSTDVVSSYVWRGALGGQGVNIQPTLSYTNNNFEIGAWGSVDWFGYKEADLYASYSIGGLSLAVTDYFWTAGAKYFSYKNDVTPHFFEGSIGYTISDDFPLSIAVNTMLYGADKDSAGDQAFSTYIEVGYSWDILSLAVGMTPADGLYGTGPNVVNIALTASQEIAITDSFSLPISASLIANPNADDIHLVLGISF